MTATESKAQGNKDVPPATDADNEKAQLEETIEAHEDVDWSEVPGVSVSEASMWTRRLVLASEEMEENHV